MQTYRYQGCNGYNAYEKNEVENPIGYSPAVYRRKRDLNSEKETVCNFTLFKLNLRTLQICRKIEFFYI
jgi:hypothetical protein